MSRAFGNVAMSARLPGRAWRTVRGVEQIPWAYDLFMGFVERFGLGVWRRELIGRAGGKILELGCGTGRNFDLYPAETAVFGLELDLQLLQRARRRGPDVPLVVGRAEALPYRNGSFDTVVSSLVFCTVSEPLVGLREVARVLAPGGRLRMLEHVRSANRLLGTVQDWIQPLWTPVAGGCHPNRDTEETVRQAGFLIERHELQGRTTLRCFSARLRETGPASG